MLRRFLLAQLLLAAPIVAQQGTFPGIVIDYSAAETGRYIGSPALAVLPDGSYVASHDLFGPASGEKEAGVTRIFISRDRGVSWRHQTDLKGQFWSGLLVHKRKLYIMGTSREVGAIVIRRSGDGGATWTSPEDGDTGVLAPEIRYHTAPVPIAIYKGRLWRAMEVAEGSRPDWASIVLSAPVGADLLKAASWTISGALQNKQAENPALAWIEGNVVQTPGRKLVNILRLNGVDQEKAAMVHVSPDGRQLTWDPAGDFIDFVGGGTKFTIRYDPKTRRYWSLVNKQKNPDTYRNVLVLTSSADLRNWRVESTVFNQFSRADRAFQYVDWLFEGDDIIAVSRTAWDGAHRPHDANYMTFHRITNFRSRSQKDEPLM
jgi:hypothetical protein